LLRQYIIKCVRHIPEISIKRSEFSSFLNKYCTAFGIYSGLNPKDCIVSTASKAYVSALLISDVIDTDKTGEYIVGFTRQKANGLITFLPFFISRSVTRVDDDKVSKLLCELRQSLENNVNGKGATFYFTLPTLNS
jgi:hypothetical protein